VVVDPGDARRLRRRPGRGDPGQPGRLRLAAAGGPARAGLRARLRGAPDLVRHQQRRAGRRRGRAGRAVRHARLLRVRRRSGRQRHRDRERLQRLRHPGHAGPRGPGAAGQRHGGWDLPADGGHRDRGRRGCGRRLRGRAAQPARCPNGRAPGGSAGRPAHPPPRPRPVRRPDRDDPGLPVQRGRRHAGTLAPGHGVDPAASSPPGRSWSWPCGAWRPGPGTSR
jgi:hypothetical protein